jgi:iron complex outermembrane receptor protein
VIRQDFENGNFISSGLHYNENRNAFYRTASQAILRAFGRDYDNLCHAPAMSRPMALPARQRGHTCRSPRRCHPPLVNGQPGQPGSCTNYYGVRINPSDTGNVRIQSLWNLSDNLRLTFDPSYQYVLAKRRRYLDPFSRRRTGADIVRSQCQRHRAST